MLLFFLERKYAVDVAANISRLWTSWKEFIELRENLYLERLADAGEYVPGKNVRGDQELNRHWGQFIDPWKVLDEITDYCEEEIRVPVA